MYVSDAGADDDDNGGENADTHHSGDAVCLISLQLPWLMKKFLSLSGIMRVRKYLCQRAD